MHLEPTAKENLLTAQMSSWWNEDAAHERRKQNRHKVSSVSVCGDQKNDYRKKKTKSFAHA